LVITPADEEERVHVEKKIRHKRREPRSALNNDERHLAWRETAAKFLPMLAAVLFIVGILAALLGFLGYLSFDVTMLTIIVCGFGGTLVAFCAISLKLSEHDD
jgi:hypothetical protein